MKKLIWRSKLKEKGRVREIAQDESLGKILKERQRKRVSKSWLNIWFSRLYEGTKLYREYPPNTDLFSGTHYLFEEINNNNKNMNLMVASVVSQLHYMCTRKSIFGVNVLLAGHLNSRFVFLLVIMIEIENEKIEWEGDRETGSESLAKFIEYLICSSVHISISTELCKQYGFDGTSAVPQLVHEGRFFFRHIWRRCVGQAVTYVTYLDLLFVTFL